VPLLEKITMIEKGEDLQIRSIMKNYNTAAPRSPFFIFIGNKNEKKGVGMVVFLGFRGSNTLLHN